jgi:AcrR family transcriptional regulator
VKRLTRAESQERTRAAVVRAATLLFLRNGFGVTSLEQVAEAAGFTRGAVYSNFDGKTAIGIAVIDELYAREERRVSAVLEALREADTDAWFDALSAWADRTIGDPEWTRLEIEIAASSAHDESYRAATAGRYARQRALCAQLIEDRFGDLGGIDTEALATAIIGMALGIGAQRAADPDVPGSTWSEVLRTAVRAAAQGAAAGT